MFKQEDSDKHRKISDAVSADCADRGEWLSRIDANRKLRFAKKNTAKELYKGAPNLSEPIIDDMIREIRTAEVTLFWNSPQLASFIGVGEQGTEFAQTAQRIFDTHLRNTKRFRRMLSSSVDMRLEIGMSIAKLVEIEGDGGIRTAGIQIVDPRNIVVPTSCEDIEKAKRICQIIKLTLDEFDSMRQLNPNWDEEKCKQLRETSLESYKKRSGTSSVGSSSQGRDRGQYKDGELPINETLIELWEVYYFSDIGRRKCVMGADTNYIVLEDSPWTYERLMRPITSVPQIYGTNGEMQTPYLEDSVPDRPFPFVQFRQEDSEGFYNTRGIGELLEQDQKEASVLRTTRAVAIDFSGKPFFRKGTGARANKFGFRAGEEIDAEEAVVWFQSPTAEHVYLQQFAESKAARRAGSPLGALSSVDPKRDKKTATEVMTQNRVSGGVSSDSVDRFAECWADLFEMMWIYNSRQAVLRGKSGMVTGDAVPLGVWMAEYVISAGISGRTANQWQVLQNIQAIAPILQLFPAIAQYVKADELGKFAFGLVSDELARKMFVSEGAGGAPIEVQLKQIAQVVGQHDKFLQALAQGEAGGGDEPLVH